MAFSVFDAVIPSQLQILRALDRLLLRAEAFAAEQGIAPADLIDARLAPDMLPFGYQVKSAAEHSLGALAGVEAGSYSPDLRPWPNDFAALHAKLAEAIAALEAHDPQALERLCAGDTTFRMGETVLPFSSVEFLLSFSQPNFYFHATTAYAILRMKGMKIGKRDFLGAPRIKR